MTARSGWGGDGEAAFPVFEAVLVAVIVLTSILFFTAFQRPTGGTDEGGIDLGQIAADTLAILQTKTFPDPAGGPELALADWVNRTLQGDADVARDVEAFLEEVLPIGTRHALRFDNGVEPLVLVPQGSDDAPRAGRAAEIFLPTAWRSHVSMAVVDDVVRPAQEVPAADFLVAEGFTAGVPGCIVGPNGVRYGPDGNPWRDFWMADPGRVPPGVPYGLWAGHAAGDCTGAADYVRVVLPDGTPTDFAVYGIQLVVWFGA